MPIQKQLVFKKDAIKYLEKLPPDIQERIFHELDRLVLGFHENMNIKLLEPKKYGFYRIRVWNLRIIFEKEQNFYRILALWPRGDVYK